MFVESMATCAWNTQTVRPDVANHRDQRPLLPIDRRGKKPVHPGQHVPGPETPGVGGQIVAGTIGNGPAIPTGTSMVTARPLWVCDIADLHRNRHALVETTPADFAKATQPVKG